MDEEAIFTLSLEEAYTLKQTVEYLKLYNTEGTFRFNRSMIRYIEMNKLGTITNELIIASHLTNYWIHDDYCSDDTGYGGFEFGTSLIKLALNLKVVKKGDGLEMYFDSSIEPLYIRHIESKGYGENNTSKQISMIVESTEYDVSGFTRPWNLPNCVVSLSKFIKACSDIVDSKCESVTLTAFISHFILEGASNSGKIVKKRILGKIPKQMESLSKENRLLHTRYIKSLRETPTDGPVTNVVVENEDIEILSMKISITDLKYWKKLKNISPLGATVRCFFEPDKPIRFVFHVGTYAELRVYAQENTLSSE